VWRIYCLRIWHQESPRKSSRFLIEGQKKNIRIANEPSENVAEFKYLGATLTNQNDIGDEIKSRLNSGNACCYSVQNLLSSHLIYVI
jgi:hypothetical protein